MDVSHSQRRRRPITACIECVRRKQRCDRRKPCGGCIARGVESRCAFPQDAERSHEMLDQVHDLATESPDLATSLGYTSQNKMSATLKTLQATSTSETSPASTNGNGHDRQLPCSLSRYRVLVSKLPSQTIIDQLVNIFFSEAGWVFCLVDRPYYEELRQLWNDHHVLLANSNAEHIPSEHIKVAGVRPTFLRCTLEVCYFPAMLFQMLALALHFLPTSSPVREDLKLTNNSGSDKISKMWSEIGNEVLVVLGRIDSPLTAVIADLLRCTWLKNSGFGGLSWHFLSDAVRQAQNLGLHRKAVIPQAHTIEDTIRNLWCDEHRRRVWVSVFSWDAHMAMSLDRPRLIVVEDCTVEKPLDCDLPAEPSKVVPTAAAVAGRPSRFTSQLFKYSIGFLMHEAMSSGALRSPCKDYSIVTTLHQRVNDVVNKFAVLNRYESFDTMQGKEYEDICKQRYQMSIIASSFVLSLHRSHVMNNATSRLTAIAAALATLTASHSLFELCDEQHYKIHTILFHTIDAVIFLSSMVMVHGQLDKSGPDTSAEDLPYYNIRDALYKAISRVAAMRTRSNVAREAEKALRKCYELVALQEHEYPIIDQPSPMESIHTSRPFNFHKIPSKTTDFSNSFGNTSSLSGSDDPIPLSYPPSFSGFVDTSSYDDMSEFLYNPEVLRTASDTSTWMEQHGFTEDTLLSSDSMLRGEFYDWYS